jgi:hypothetical protein
MRNLKPIQRARYRRKRKLRPVNKKKKAKRKHQKEDKIKNDYLSFQSSVDGSKSSFQIK